jgi:hypothetical protein
MMARTFPNQYTGFLSIFRRTLARQGTMVFAERLGVPEFGRDIDEDLVFRNGCVCVDVHRSYGLSFGDEVEEGSI